MDVVHAVGEDGDVAVGEHVRMMLMAPGAISQTPRDRARLPTDNHDCVEMAKAHENVTVQGWGDGVGKREYGSGDCGATEGGRTGSQ